MRPTLCLLLLTLIVTLPADAPAQYGTGGIDLWQDRPLVPYKPAPALPSPNDLPTRHVNHLYLPPVLSQGAEPSCHYWALVYYYRSWQEAREQGWTNPDPFTQPERVMRHSFSYRLQDDSLDHGAISWADYAEGFNEAGWPTREQWQAALAHRHAGYSAIDLSAPDGIDTLRAHLASGDLAYFGLSLGENFTYTYPSNGEGIDNEVLYAMSSEPYDPPGPETTNLHALILIGYDDTKTYFDGSTNQQGAFLAVNSWGTDWGCNVPEVGTPGFIWLGYGFLSQHATAQAATIMTDAPSVAPTELLVLELDHGRLLELGARLMGGNPDDPAWTFEIPLLSGDRRIDSRMVFDLSDYPVADTGAFRLRISDLDVGMIPDMNPPSYTGLVEYFAIESATRPAPWVCRNTPAETIDHLPGDVDPDKYLLLDIALFEKREEIEQLPDVGRGNFLPADFNDDGWPDLLLTSKYFYGEAFTGLYENDGAGNFSFREAGLPAASGPITVGDLNNDGAPDLAIAPEGSNTIDFFLYSASQNTFVPGPDSLACENCVQIALPDINRDGHADLAAMSDFSDDWFEGQQVALSVWLSDGDGGFTPWDHGVAIQAHTYPYQTMEWADFDGDGWTDLALGAARMETQPGWEWPIYQPYLVLFLNQQGSGLTESWRGDVGSPHGMGCGDLNADGMPDLIHFEYSYTRLFLNDGAGGFTETATNLPAFYHARTDVADFDNDGLADLVLSGQLQESGLPGLCGLFRNLGAGQFQDLTGETPDLDEGMARLLDLDRDGDLDLIVQAETDSPEAYGLHVLPYFAVFENGTAQDDRLDRPNTPPAAPTNLSIERDEANNRLVLRWDSASDAETPSAGLSYQVCVERYPGWNDLLSGLRLESGSGSNMDAAPLGGSGPGALLSPIPTGACALRVQTVDGARAASDWSAPLQISASSSFSEDVNDDGTIDVADLATIQRVMMGMDSDPDHRDRADLSGEGTVNGLDRLLLRSRILENEAPDPDTLSVHYVGPGGGIVTTKDFHLSIPPGALAENHELRLLADPLDLPADSGFLSPAYRLEGLPGDYAATLTLRIRLDQTPAETPRLARGLEGWRSSARGIGLAWSQTETTDAGNGWYECLLPPLEPVTPSRLNNPRYQFEVETGWFGLATGNTILSSDHFSIYYPNALSPSDMIATANALETSWDLLHGPGGHGFNPALLPTGGTRIFFEKMDWDGFSQDVPGRNSDTIHLNQDRLPGSFAQTGSHEFMHHVAAAYLPASPSSGLAHDPYWPDEACATWFESRISIPTIFYDNMHAPFTGMVAGVRNFFAPSSKAKQDHGYGMASLFEYFTNHKGQNGFPGAFWNNVRLGYSMPESVRRAAGKNNYDWYTDYLETILTQTLIQSTRYEKARDIAGDKQRKLSETSPGTVFENQGYLPALSADLFMTHIDRDNLDPSAMISHRIQKNEQLDFSLLQMLAPTASLPDQTTLLGRAVEANGALKFDVPVGSLGHDEGYKILALITNHDGNISGPKASYWFQSALTEDKTWSFPSYYVYGPYANASYPVFDVTASIDGPGLAQVETIPIDRGIIFAYAQALGQPPAEYNISVRAPLSVSFWSDWITGTEYHIDGIDYYKLSYYNEEGNLNGELEKIIQNDTGDFTLPLSLTSHEVSGTVYASCTTLLEDDSFYESFLMPVFSFYLQP